jgi:hypothetical protein
VLVAGAVFIMRRSPAVAVSEAAPAEIEFIQAARPAKAHASDKSSLLLDALKEELFQLEVEHKQGRIPQQEYEKAKAALDQTLERALKRGTRAPSSVR